MIIQFVSTTQEQQESAEHFKELSRLIGIHLDPEFDSEFVPHIYESLGEFTETFKTFNGNDISAKSIVYRDLGAVGEFSFVFSMLVDSLP